ncbi:hypothetical protein K457DRAFT_751120 [Linnemannia elongata AG-77]|uniref:Uncharacterized protein n=1 Tax=Linnemannia elongata AG-77 TaxID=1314771 RepID=A0A197JKP1_9FUNG|nr:hypothetical protein K457DRAFT_751120 [Linnemannia elongata AG-77]
MREVPSSPSFLLFGSPSVHKLVRDGYHYLCTFFSFFLSFFLSSFLSFFHLFLFILFPLQKPRFLFITCLIFLVFICLTKYTGEVNGISRLIAIYLSSRTIIIN